MPLYVRKPQCRYRKERGSSRKHPEAARPRAHGAGGADDLQVDRHRRRTHPGVATPAAIINTDQGLKQANKKPEAAVSGRIGLVFGVGGEGFEPPTSLRQADRSCNHVLKHNKINSMRMVFYAPYLMPSAILARSEEMRLCIITAVDPNYVLFGGDGNSGSSASSSAGTSRLAVFHTRSRLTIS